MLTCFTIITQCRVFSFICNGLDIRTSYVCRTLVQGMFYTVFVMFPNKGLIYTDILHRHRATYRLICTYRHLAHAIHCLARRQATITSCLSFLCTCDNWVSYNLAIDMTSCVGEVVRYHVHAVSLSRTNDASHRSHHFGHI